MAKALKTLKRRLKPIVKFLGLWQIVRTRLAKKYLFGNGLEIGALHQPLKIPSRVRIRYVDVMTREQSIKSFPDLDAGDIVNVDFVTNGFTLEGVPSGEFDFLVANHVLEHTPNPIGALIQWHRVLKDGGILFCTLPKVNASFDKGRRVTTYDHLIEDYNVYETQNLDGARERNKDHYFEWLSICEPAVFKRPPMPAEAMAKRIEEMSERNDEIHFHTFTGASIRNMFAQIGKNILPGLSTLEIVETRKDVVAVLKKQVETP